MTPDFALAVEFILGVGVEYGSAIDYSTLVETWRDARPLPTLQALEAAWLEVLALQDAEVTEQAQADAEKQALGRAQLVAILAQIQARQTEITADRTALAAVTTLAQVRPIVDRVLVAQNQTLSLLILIGKALSRLV